MSGPIVRTGATPEFWKNWDQIFGKKTKKRSDSDKSSSSRKPAGKATGKSAGKKSTATAKSATRTTGKAKKSNRKK